MFFNCCKCKASVGRNTLKAVKNVTTVLVLNLDQWLLSWDKVITCFDKEDCHPSRVIEDDLLKIPWQIDAPWSSKVKELHSFDTYFKLNCIYNFSTQAWALRTELNRPDCIYNYPI